MSVFKTTFSRALKVAVTPNCDIPFPNIVASGISEGPATDKLVDNTINFIALNVKEGDIVYNIDTNEGATVVSVNGANDLVLNADIFSSAGAKYRVYQASSQTGLGNQGCFLYIGDSDSDYAVVTIGGDEVEFRSPIRGSVLPVQVIKVINGGSCIALW